MKIHALWCHPRSMSTAVERIMRERGDLTVLHEPFMYDYYIGGARDKFTGFAPESGHPTTYDGIRQSILETAEKGPVFLKDMAYYVRDTLPADPGFAAQMTHCFLIRDPAEAVISYVKRQQDFSLEEVGLEAQWELFCGLRDLGLSPVVLSASAIRMDPAAQMARYWSLVNLADAPHALHWNGTVPTGWRSVETWYQEVLQTTGILPPDANRDIAAELAALGEPYISYVAHHRLFYDRLMQTHQK